jgi:hypothetical protein
VPSPERTNEWHIYAIKPGVVSHSFYSESYGNTVLIRDADGITARYAHLDSVDPKIIPGARVGEGQIIGVMGSTGFGYPESNKHLHVSVYPAGTTAWNPSTATINPVDYIRGGTYPANTFISTPFGFLIGGTTPHEGTDMSGNPANLIPGWQQGITGAAGIQININNNRLPAPTSTNRPGPRPVGR